MTSETATLHILTTGPHEEIYRTSKGERWCFVCRKRREFVLIVEWPVDPMSWYGPSTSIECTVCKTTDGDCFPGTEREWSE